MRLLTSVLFLALFATACGDSTTPSSLEGAAATIHGGDCVESTGDTVTIYSGRSENLIEPVLDAFECSSGNAVEVRWGGSAELATVAPAQEQAVIDAAAECPGECIFIEFATVAELEAGTGRPLID